MGFSRIPFLNPDLLSAARLFPASTSCCKFALSSGTIAPSEFDAELSSIEVSGAVETFGFGYTVLCVVMISVVLEGQCDR